MLFREKRKAQTPEKQVDGLGCAYDARKKKTVAKRITVRGGKKKMYVFHWEKSGGEEQKGKGVATKGLIALDYGPSVLVASSESERRHKKQDV